MGRAKCDHNCFECPYPDCIDTGSALTEWEKEVYREIVLDGEGSQHIRTERRLHEESSKAKQHGVDRFADQHKRQYL